MTTLHQAAAKGALDALERLLEREEVDASDADGTTPLILAATWGHARIIEALVRRGADVNRANAIGYTPLMTGARHGWLEVVDILLSSAADPNAGDADGRTALVWAAGYSPKPQVIDALIDRGGDPNLASADGTTPLMWAAGAGLVMNVERLMAGGAKADARDARGRTARMRAAERGRAAVLKLFDANCVKE